MKVKTFLSANATVVQDVRMILLVKTSITFVVTYALDIDGVETFTIHIAVLVLVGRLYSDVRAIDASDHAGKSSSPVKSSF